MNEPLITCIMPTRNRRQFVSQALKYFLDQSYWNKELIVVDDGEDSVADLMPDVPHIRYVAVSEPLTIGMKRNLACSLAHGEIITHWDDDDYFGPQRLSKQAEPLLADRADVSGLRMSLLLRTADMSLWQPSDAVHDALFGYGLRCGTLMYRSYCWRGENRAYSNVERGEDTFFLSRLYEDGAKIERLTSPASYICVRHGDNVTDDIAGMGEPGWEQVPIGNYLSADEQAFYRSLTPAVIL